MRPNATDAAPAATIAGHTRRIAPAGYGCARQRKRGQHNQQPVPDVSEHHPEHRAVRDRDEWRRIEVAIGHRPIGGQQHS
jgi:hypothetical protein